MMLRDSTTAETPRRDPNAASPEVSEPRADTACAEVLTDERWVSEFPNDLGCLSLSADDTAESGNARHRDELGLQLSIPPSDSSEHLHEEVGI